jgi:RNA polymerase sigma-70 factor (ECF subfamily)
MAELVRRAKRGQSSAFSELVRQFERTALGVAFAVCGDAALAGDVTQEAFLRAWRKLGELSDNAKFGGWLCGIVRNLAIDAIRTRGRGKEVSDDGSVAAAEELADPISQVQRFEQSDQIDWALRQLDEPSRTAIVLRYYQNLSSAEIAGLTGATIGAVDTRLSRARRTLRYLLSGSTCGVGIDDESRTT